MKLLLVIHMLTCCFMGCDGQRLWPFYGTWDLPGFRPFVPDYVQEQTSTMTSTKYTEVRKATAEPTEPTSKMTGSTYTEMPTTTTEPTDKFQCPNNWKSLDGRCYYVSKTTATWHDARNYCRSQGGDLAVPTSWENNQHIYQAIKERYISTAWIGLYRKTQPHMLFWYLDYKGFDTVQGFEPSYENWYAPEPNDAGGEEDCVEIMYTAPYRYYKKYFDANGQWNDQTCNWSRHYVCELTNEKSIELAKNAEANELNMKTIENSKNISPKSLSTTNTNVVSRAKSCPSNWENLDDRCYYISNSTATWHDARTDCRARNGYLTVPTTAKTNQRIYEAIKERDIGTVWIGLYRTENTDFVPDFLLMTKNLGEKFLTVQNTKLSFKNWYEHEPNDYGETEDCVEIMYSPPYSYYSKYIDAGGKWNDLTCDWSRHYVCELKQTKKFGKRCPGNWQSPDGRCYYISKTSATWRVARDDCNARGGDLAVPTSWVDNQDIYQAIKERRISTAWIGMYRAIKDLQKRFHTVRGAVLSYENWHLREPSDSGGFENCVELMYSPTYRYYGKNFDAAGRWNDLTCNWLRHYVCELEDEEKQLKTTESPMQDWSTTELSNKTSEVFVARN